MQELWQNVSLLAPPAPLSIFFYFVRATEVLKKTQTMLAFMDRGIERKRRRFVSEQYETLVNAMIYEALLTSEEGCNSFCGSGGDLTMSELESLSYQHWAKKGLSSEKQRRLKEM